MSSFPIFLRIDAGTWSRVGAATLPNRTLTVAAAFALASWNRFGAQGFFEPRAILRMLITGIWGWLALSLVLWVIARRVDEELRSDPVTSMQRTVASVTVAHFPLIILGFYIATFGAFIRTPVPGTILAVAVFAVWIPRLLVRAFQHVAEVDVRTAAGAIVVPYLLWLATIGRWLFIQVGHLL